MSCQLASSYMRCNIIIMVIIIIIIRRRRRRRRRRTTTTTTTATTTLITSIHYSAPMCFWSMSEVFNLAVVGKIIKHYQGSETDHPHELALSYNSYILQLLQSMYLMEVIHVSVCFYRDWEVSTCTNWARVYKPRFSNTAALTAVSSNCRYRISEYTTIPPAFLNWFIASHQNVYIDVKIKLCILYEMEQELIRVSDFLPVNFPLLCSSLAHSMGSLISSIMTDIWLINWESACLEQCE